MVSPLWYRLTQVVLEKRPLNGHVCEMYLVNTGSHPHTVAVSCVHCDVVLEGDDHDHEMSVQPLMKRSGVLVATMLQQLVWAKCAMWRMH